TAWVSGGQQTKLKLWYGTYRYNGTGWAGTDYNIEGMGYRSTTVLLGASSYLITGTAAISSLELQGVQFSGGLGAVHFTRTADNVTQHFNVDRCWFLNYTQTAIGDTSSDMPYWKISRSIFKGANSTNCIGVALAGLTDDSTITDCSFLTNAVHVKAGLGGNNLILRNVDL